MEIEGRTEDPEESSGVKPFGNCVDDEGGVIAHAKPDICEFAPMEASLKQHVGEVNNASNRTADRKTVRRVTALEQPRRSCD
jgi:hypothetical protein